MTDKQAEVNPKNTVESIEYQHINQPNVIGMTQKDYGENYQAHLLEQYKLYVQITDKISTRRSQMNSFYISLPTGLLAFLSLVAEKKLASEFQNTVFLAIAILGLILCFLWYVNIQSYKQLNSGKFKVIHEMEKHLPFACYDLEWDTLKKNKNNKGYLNQTSIQKNIPLAFATPYVGLLIYSIFKLLQ